MHKYTPDTPWTGHDYFMATQEYPEQDQLDAVNCPTPNAPHHLYCGVCAVCGLPINTIHTNCEEYEFRADDLVYYNLAGRDYKLSVHSVDLPHNIMHLVDWSNCGKMYRSVPVEYIRLCDPLRFRPGQLVRSTIDTFVLVEQVDYEHRTVTGKMISSTGYPSFSLTLKFNEITNENQSMELNDRKPNKSTLQKKTIQHGSKRIVQYIWSDEESEWWSDLPEALRRKYGYQGKFYQQEFSVSEQDAASAGWSPHNNNFDSCYSGWDRFLADRGKLPTKETIETVDVRKELGL